MKIQEILTLYDQQVRQEIEYPDMRKDVLPNLVRFVRPAAGISFIQYSHLNQNNVDATIQEQVDFFSQINQPFEWKVFAYDSPSDLKARLSDHGFIPEELESVMVLDLQEAEPTLIKSITMEVRQITSREKLKDVVRVEEQVWGSDSEWILERLGGHLKIPEYLEVYVAYLGDQPVCTGWIYFHPHSQFADLWGGSTIEEYRKRGLYTAVLAIRVQAAIRHGYRFLTVDAGPMSQPIVEQHGFRLLTTVQDFAWKKENA